MVNNGLKHLAQFRNRLAIFRDGLPVADKVQAALQGLLFKLNAPDGDVFARHDVIQ